MRIWTDDIPVRPEPAAARRGLGRLTALLLALCLPVGVAAAGEAEPMVMSSLRVAGYPTPEVPSASRAEDAYFADAVLVGDSTAEPFGIHETIPGLEVLTVIGISPRTAATNQLFANEGKACTLADKLAALRPGKVYLWLGSNGVDTKTAEQVVDDYDRLLNVLLAELPDTLFYLMELTPVKRVAQESYANYTNERVDTFNAGLREVARRHNVYLLPINHLLRNDAGLLDNEYGAGDGIHLRQPAYAVLADYLYTHTIPHGGSS